MEKKELLQFFLFIFSFLIVQSVDVHVTSEVWHLLLTIITPTWDWIVKIEISLIFLLSLSNLNFYKILVKNWTIMKNFMPDFTCMVLQSVIQEKAFLKINFLIAMTSNIFNTQILLNLNFNEDLWNKILL